MFAYLYIPSDELNKVMKISNVLFKFNDVAMVKVIHELSVLQNIYKDFRNIWQITDKYYFSFLPSDVP